MVINLRISRTFTWNYFYHHVIVIEYVFSICTINTGDFYTFNKKKTDIIIIKFLIIKFGSVKIALWSLVSSE